VCTQFTAIHALGILFRVSYQKKKIPVSQNNLVGYIHEILNVQQNMISASSGFYRKLEHF